MKLNFREYYPYFDRISMIDFKDKVVIVTGASSGIGEGAAKEFAKQGASLVIIGRNMENLNAVAEQCKSSGAPDVLAVKAEFQNFTDIKNVVDETIQRFKKVDCLINNVGVTHPGYLSDFTSEDFDWVFQINVKSAVYLTQLVMPYLIQTKGSIVNVSSISGTHQFPDRLIYCMSKAALDQFTKTIAVEFASKGVRVNSINPSFVRTNINRYKGMSEDEIEKMYEKTAKLHPMESNGTVEETANAIVFLASNASSWTTGQRLIIDGGRTLNVPQMS